MFEQWEGVLCVVTVQPQQPNHESSYVVTCRSCAAAGAERSCLSCDMPLCCDCAGVHDCMHPAHGYDDSPRGYGQQQAPIAETGGSGDTSQPPMTKSHRLWLELEDLWSGAAGVLQKLGSHLWARMRYLEKVSQIRVISTTENAYEQFGTSQVHWRRLAHHMQWDFVGIVVFNMSCRKCLVYSPGQTPEFANASSALRWLRSFPTALGIVQRSVDGDGMVEYSHLEVWWHPEERGRPKIAAIEQVLDRLVQTIVNNFSGVTFRSPAA